MTHFGLICPATTGHLNTFLPLGQALQNRGHRVTLFGIPELENRTIATGIEFQPIGIQDYPPGTMVQLLAHLGQLQGNAALRYTFQLFRKRATVLLRDVPPLIQTKGIEALLIDQFVLEGGSIAEALGIPFITVCSALILHQEPDIPPFYTLWTYHPNPWTRLRNQIGYTWLNHLSQPLFDVIQTYRRQWHLPLHQDWNQYYSPLAQLSQEPAEFEFPRQNLPPWLHFIGPCRQLQITQESQESQESQGIPFRSQPNPPFPYENLTGAPLIYAAMGTIMGQRIQLFETIAQACHGLQAQLVIALGGAIQPHALPPLPGNPLVVPYAPQLELLQRASLTITHAGLNTTLESLSRGVPIVALPLANDGPGVAARIQWTGAGKCLNPRYLTVARLRQAVEAVLTNPSYRLRARQLQQAIDQTGGLPKALQIIETAVNTQEPVRARA